MKAQEQLGPLTRTWPRAQKQDQGTVRIKKVQKERQISGYDGDNQGPGNRNRESRKKIQEEGRD